MHIQFLYFEDCPSHETALQRLYEVLDETAIRATVAVIRVESEAQAQQLRFAGSPTILINGQDMVTPDQGTAYALTCRAYRLQDGRISPLPSKATIQSALQRETNRSRE